jgi:hypothetical protein
MIVYDETLTRDLAMLGGGGLGDAELDRRVTRFQGALDELRGDPAEAARIDAMAIDAERDQTGTDSYAKCTHVSGRDITVNITQAGGDAESGQGEIAAELAAVNRERLRLEALMESVKPRPRGLWPAFGVILVVALAAATVASIFHASAAAAAYGTVILAAATAATALLSSLMAWTSVRELNRAGRAREALELMAGAGSPGIAGRRRAQGPGPGEAGHAQAHGEHPDLEVLWRILDDFRASAGAELDGPRVSFREAAGPFGGLQHRAHPGSHSPPAGRWGP